MAAKKKSPAERPLSERELRFAEHYASTGIGNEAARLAGYSAATPQMAAYRLLQRPKVQEAILLFRAEQAAKSGISPEFVHAGLKREAVSAFNARDRIKAFELLGKAQAMFVERHELDDVSKLSNEEREARLKAILLRGKLRADASKAPPSMDGGQAS